MASKPNVFAANTICDRAKRSSSRVCVLMMDVSAQSEYRLKLHQVKFAKIKTYSLPTQTVDLGLSVWSTWESKIAHQQSTYSSAQLQAIL